MKFFATAALGFLVASCGGDKSWRDDLRPVRPKATPAEARPYQPPPRPDLELRSPEESDVLLQNDGPLVGTWPRGEARRITITFHRTSIHNALRFFAEVTRLNIVVADEVQGEVTMKLKHVPWRQALRVVLQVKDLVAVREGNVVRVLRAQDWYQETSRE